MEMCCTHEEHSCIPFLSDSISFDFPHYIAIKQCRQAVHMIHTGGHRTTAAFQFHNWFFIWPVKLLGMTGRPRLGR